MLDEHTINKIAAGEVIESPASVIKELVENSLDAGSTDICIEIKGGGRQLIRITDNGCGMNRDDALLCLERHATSKIKEVEDIQDIFTMGFRGEAIPSIASISKFMLHTATEESKDEGTMLLVDGGRILQCGSAIRSRGTTIEVKSLFFNVPVRRKFQKSPAYDSNEILKVVTLLALCNPSVKFQLIDNQKTEIQTAVSGSNFQEHLEERIGSIMGQEFIKGCCSVDISKGSYSLKGFIGLPSFSRQNRTGQYLFINKRVVTSPLISFIVRDAYGTTLQTNRHPIFVLHLDVPREIVDVNVHPQKKEVRLKQETDLREMLSKGIAQALHKGATSTHSLFSSKPIEQVEEPIPSFAYEMPVIKPAFSLTAKEDFSKDDYKPYSHSTLVTQDRTYNQPLLLNPEKLKGQSPKVLTTIPRYIILDTLSLHAWKDLPKETLCLIDQKAAHSRVVFENLSSNKLKKGIQSLLIPVPLKLNTIETDLLKLHIDNLNEHGLHIHEIGLNSFLIDAIPDIFGNIDLEKFIKDLISNLSHFEVDNLIEKEIEKQIALAASYASVTNQKLLRFEEAQALIDQLFLTEMPLICPQGKPTLSFFTEDELMKKFQKRS
jgi:DNA mismatch repair protein MutL